MSGLFLRDAAVRTGWTVRQLRRLVELERIRFKKVGGRVLLHPEDVKRLANETWQGQEVGTEKEVTK